jgi:hypothetical protein
LVSDVNGRIWTENIKEQCAEPKRNEIIGGWGKLRIEASHNLYYSPNII